MRPAACMYGLSGWVTGAGSSLDVEGPRSPGLSLGEVPGVVWLEGNLPLFLPDLTVAPYTVHHSLET